MKTVGLPGTDLRVSIVGLGCWALGNAGWGDVDASQARETIGAALDAGITLFDTAPLYGLADERLRDALGPRIRDVVVATKIGAREENGRALSDLSPAHLERDLHASLRRLQVEKIDLLQVHWPCDLGTPLEDTLQSLLRFKEAGKVRHFGLCNYGIAEVERAVGQISTLQLRLSALERGLEADSAAAGRSNIGVLAYEPLARGLLSGKHAVLPRFSPRDVRHQDRRFWAAGFARAQPIVEQLRRAAQQHQVPTAAMAIAWVARRAGVRAVLFGARNAAQVRENALAASLFP